MYLAGIAMAKPCDQLLETANGVGNPLSRRLLIDKFAIEKFLADVDTKNAHL